MEDAFDQAIAEQARADFYNNCNTCNFGICTEMDRLVKDKKLSVRKAAEILARAAAQKAKKEDGSEEFAPTANQIRNRYQYYMGQRDPQGWEKKKVAQVAPPQTPEQKATALTKQILSTCDAIVNAFEAADRWPINLESQSRVHLQQALSQLKNFAAVALNDLKDNV